MIANPYRVSGMPVVIVRGYADQCECDECVVWRRDIAFDQLDRHMAMMQEQIRRWMASEPEVQR